MLRRSSKTTRTSRTTRTTKTEDTGPARRVARDRVEQVFSPNVSPALTVSRGETIVVETQDCYRGLLTAKQETDRDDEGSGGIPVTGPIYVEDAHIGDVLSIQVKQIKTAGTGVFAVQPESGLPGQDLQKPGVRILEVKEKQVQLDDRLNLPLSPVIGNIGVAAKHGEIDSVYPGRHGGNMDTLEITTGSKVYLPVQVNGALLSLGDVKACVGDGQIAGSGVEVEAEVTVRVDTLPGGRFSWPRVESKGEWVTITSASTVDQAARLAITEMVKWITQDKGLDFDTAYALVSLGGSLRVSQWGNPLTTVRMVFPKRLISKLKSVPAASGKLNYRSLPPAANGNADGDAVAAEAEQPAARSSRRSGSGRRQRASGRSRQSGNRGGDGKQSNGADSPERSDSSQQESAPDAAPKQKAAAKQDSAVKQDAVPAQDAEIQQETPEVKDAAAAGQDAAAPQDAAQQEALPAQDTQDEVTEIREEKDSPAAGKENGRGDRAGKTGRSRTSGRRKTSSRRKTSAAKKDTSTEPAEASSDATESATEAGNEPKAEAASIASEASETAARPVVREETEVLATPANGDGPDTLSAPAGGDSSKALSDSQAEDSAQPAAADRKPTFGRRQRRTVRR